jgi:hypothetical protein
MGVSITTVEALRIANHEAVHLRERDLIRLPDPRSPLKPCERAESCSHSISISETFWPQRAPLRRASLSSACEIKRLFRVISDL